MRIKTLSIGLVAILLSACVHRIGGYTLMSSKNVNLNSGK